MRPQTILPDALSAVGDTPLIRLNRIPQRHGIRCNVLVKCEFFNAGGSVKDRIAKRMLLEAEREGKLVPGKSVIVEPTSGNTGIGLALACAVRGYRCIIVLPEKMSAEKVSTLKALGAEVVRTPTEAAWDDPRSNIMVARRLAGEILDAHILDQYNNINNPLAHRATAEEIIEAVSGGASALGGVLESATNAMQNLGLGTGAGERPLTPATTPDASPLHVPTSINGSTNAHAHANRGDADIQHASLPTSSSPVVDVLIAGVGTGGTISGIAARLKEKDHNPNLYVVGVDPVGSTLAVPAELNTLPEGSDGQYKIEGIGYDFDPASLDKSLINVWLKTTDLESFSFARELIRTEGLLIGGSSGSAIAGAMRWLKGEGWAEYGSRQDRNVVVMLPDSLRNYVTKDWLLEGSASEV